MNLTIIIPACREEDTILKTLSALERHVRTPHETIVVNDYIDASDHTASLVSTYRRKHPNVRVIIHPRKKGKGGFASTLARGIREVGRGAVVFVMADLCDQPETIDVMYKKILEGWDVVCGSRYTKGGGKIGGSWLQGLFSWFVNTTLFLGTGVPTRDVSNAFKMYRKNIFDRITVDETSGVECSMDWTLQVYFGGARITEIPTRWRGRTVGQSKFRLLERAPRYLRIYLWALVNTCKRSADISKGEDKL